MMDLTYSLFLSLTPIATALGRRLFVISFQRPESVQLERSRIQLL